MAGSLGQHSVQVWASGVSDGLHTQSSWEVSGAWGNHFVLLFPVLTTPAVGRNRGTRAIVPTLPPDDLPAFAPYAGVKTSSQITWTQSSFGAVTYKPPICNSRKQRIMYFLQLHTYLHTRWITILSTIKQQQSKSLKLILSLLHKFILSNRFESVSISRNEPNWKHKVFFSEAHFSI